MTEAQLPVIREITAESVYDDISRGFLAAIQEFSPEIVEGIPEKIIDGKVTMLVAEGPDGRPMGHVAIAWDGTQNPLVRRRTNDRVNIAFLGVPEAERGKGFGTALMLEAIATINGDERRNRGICLSVEMGNPSINIYRDLGFVALGKPIDTPRGLVQPMELPQA